MPEARGIGPEELDKARGQGGGSEELPHPRGQGRWPGGATPHQRPGAPPRRSYTMPEARGGGQRGNPRSGDCAGAGGPREAIPR